MASARHQTPAVYRRRRLAVLASLATVLALAYTAAHSFSNAVPPAPHPSHARARRVGPDAARQPSGLRPGSDPSVLPGPLLIADRGNNRLIEVSPDGRILWQFPRPGDLAAGQTFRIPDDAFFTPDRSSVIVTEEDDFVVTLVDIARHRITWRYGRPGVSGAGPDRLWNPDDAMVLRSGDVLTADIKNCRIIVIRRGAHVPAVQLGAVGSCYHDPPYAFASPNGAFPMRNGDLLVTEIGGDWVDEIGPGPVLVRAVNPPGVVYPSDTNEVAPGRYLTVDYSQPGQIIEFDASGRLLWRFAPGGPQALNHPSLALPLPNGDVVCNDDRNDRVIVVDPRSNRIVWQYGVTGRPGSGLGLLDNPDGVDLAPPFSLLVTHAASMREPTG